MELLQLVTVSAVLCLQSVNGAPITIDKISYLGDDSILTFDKTEAGKQTEFILSFLVKYGYIEQPTVDGISPIKETTLEVESVKDAIRCMQKVAGLIGTGIVDETTLTLMQTPRCGFRDADICKSRKKRFLVSGRLWTHTDITWRMTNYTQQLPQELLDNETSDAFNLWAAVSPLRFQKSDNYSDIEMFFAVGEHGDPVDAPFDGPRGVLAHAFYPGYSHPVQGDIHFDDDETWLTIPENNVSGIHYFPVVLHEIGHALGLGHSDDRNAIMFPYYNASNRELGEDDINGIHENYYGNITVKTTTESSTETSTIDTSTYDSTKSSTETSTIDSSQCVHRGITSFILPLIIVCLLPIQIAPF